MNGSIFGNPKTPTIFAKKKHRIKNRKFVRKRIPNSVHTVIRVVPKNKREVSLTNHHLLRSSILVTLNL